MAPVDLPHTNNLAQAMQDGQGRPAEIVAAAMAEISSGPPAPAHKNALLRTLLKYAVIPHAGFEVPLTTERALFLREAVIDEDRLLFGCALAQQCFLTEYAYVETPEEASHAHGLRTALEAALAAGEQPPALWLAAVGCYTPLHRIAGAKRLAAMSWPEAVRDLVIQQITEPAEERSLREAIPRLTPIDDPVSAEVRRQYEESPYPRWAHPNPVIGSPSSLDDFFAANYPAFRPFGGSDVLVAGCGTGRHAIEIARQLDQAKVLAVDLSRTSLAYAMRKARELRVLNIQHAQADILGLSALGLAFDLIEAGGVLHHMGDPFAGWRALLAVLRPRGVMWVSLYSERGRRSLMGARSLIAERGWAPTPEGIRACRQELIHRGDPSTGWVDFYTMSECRDLLFHVQEHRLDLPTIGGFLAENGLEFLGFDVAEEIRARFLARYPGRLTDLAAWAEFEQDNPETFRTMYRLAVQRRP